MRHRHAVRNVRIRITIAFIALLVMIAGTAVADDPAPSHARKLVLAQGHGWDASLLALSNSPELERVILADCIGAGWGWEFNLPPGAAALRRHAASAFCASVDAAFFLVDAPTNAAVMSLLSFESDSAQSSFTLGPIGYIDSAHPATLGPMISDSVDGAWITVFPAEPTPMHILIAGQTGPDPIAVEEFVAMPPVHQHRIAHKSDQPLTAHVRVGYEFFGCGIGRSCSDFRVYGFGTSGRPDGGSMRTFQFAMP